VSKNICIFCGSSKGNDESYRNAAVEIGEYFAKNDIGLVYGGGRIGLMGIIANAVLENDGKVTGVIPGFLMTKEIRHDGLTVCYEVDSMHERKRKMYELSDAFIAMPGGFGTLDELFEIITWHQLFLHQKPIVIYNVNGYFDLLIKMIGQMRDNGFIEKDFDRYLKHGNTLPEIMQALGSIPSL
jgi:uncharacterized protein (TIGR00730 family)